MVYVSRLIRHPRPGFRFLQEPLNQACGAQNQWLVYLQKRFCPKKFCPKKVCEPRDRAYYDLTPEYREHARGDSPG